MAPVGIFTSKEATLAGIRDSGIFSITGLAPFDDDVICEHKVGRLLVAKYVVKAAMDENLFDDFVWISLAEWSVKNVQIKVVKSLGLHESWYCIDEFYEEKIWDERDACRVIYNSVSNKRVLYVLEDPPRDGIKLFEVGLPPFYGWGLSKLLIVSPSEDICRVMQCDSSFWLHGSVNLIEKDCLDIANLPMFRPHFTQGTVFTCFKSLCLFQHGRDQDIPATTVYLWWGEGLLGQGSNAQIWNSGTISMKNAFLGKSYCQSFKDVVLYVESNPK